MLAVAVEEKVNTRQMLDQVVTVAVVMATQAIPEQDRRALLILAVEVAVVGVV